MQGIRTIILGGGRGARLDPLTRDRAKPGVPFAGKYRLIDISLSNCIHSELDEVYILTQFNSASLNRHIADTYYFGSLSHRAVRVLAAQQTPTSEEWYRGTADAVRQNLSYLVHTPEQPEHLLILSGDHLYRMDYRKMIAAHSEKEADITISVLPVHAHEAGRFGILKAEGDGRITRFVEKPQTREALEGLSTEMAVFADLLPHAGNRPFLASMGIYLFRTQMLLEALAHADHTDFGQHLIPASIASHRVYAYPFSGYWKDIGTIRAYYEASLELLETVPPFDFYNETAPIYTYRFHLPNTKINESRVLRSTLAEGSIIDHSEIVHSIIGLRCFVGAGTKIEDSLILGYDYYESAEQIEAQRQRGIPRMGIGQRCYIRGAIIDKNARIGDNVVLVNHSGAQQADAEHFCIRDGIIVVPRNGMVPSGTVA
jgi:glucose-1-phosphate adenylyltransferase